LYNQLATRIIFRKLLVRFRSLSALALFLTNSLDQDSLVEALKFSLTLSKTEPLASAIVARQDPAPDVVSDADLANYVKTYVRTIHHPIGK
jgi:choline dehydrogenase-like flavoprotein